MTFEFFKARYGEAFYSFLNSELGMAMVSILEKNDPAMRLGVVPPEDQVKNSTLYLGQITGWRDCIHAIKTSMIVLPDSSPQDIEATYEAELDVPVPQAEKPSNGTPPPMVLPPQPKPRKRKK